MDIDKTDFVNLLAEVGSEITAPDASTFKGICVLLQRAHQLPDAKLEPGDLMAYIDPGNSFELGTLFSFDSYDFILVSQRKVKYIGNNPIYRLLGFRRFAPCIELQSAYFIHVCLSTNLFSSYSITPEALGSILIPSSYSIPQNIFSQSLFSLYSLDRNLVHKSLFSSYIIPQNVFSIPLFSSYSITPKVSASMLFPSLYNITQNLFSIFAPSSYDILIAPAQVTGLRAEADEGRNIWTFWIAIEDEDLDYYKVHRSTSSDFTPSDANLVGIPKTNQFAHKDLDSVTKYYVKVCAVSKQGDSGSYSTQAYATTVE